MAGYSLQARDSSVAITKTRSYYFEYVNHSFHTFFCSFTDSSHLTGYVKRQIVVYDPCPPPQFTCPNTRLCSVFGNCSKNTGALSRLMNSGVYLHCSAGLYLVHSCSVVWLDGSYLLCRSYLHTSKT